MTVTDSQHLVEAAFSHTHQFEVIVAGSRNLLLPVLCVALTACSTSSPRQQQKHEELAARIDAVVESRLADGFSGALLVAKDGAIVLEKAYGSIQDTPVQTQSHFYIASITKQFTAVALLKLQERGALQLGNTIDKYFVDVPSDKRAITIQQLLTHRSGFGQTYRADGIASRAEAVRQVLEQPLKVQPGEKFQYSNDNYALAAAIVEIVSEGTFESFVRAELLLPAGMKNTGFWGSEQITSVLPVREPDNEMLTKPENKARQWGMIGSDGMFSTLRDLYSWTVALRSGRVLSQQSTSALFAREVELAPGMWYGLGWFVSEEPNNSIRYWTRGTEGFGANGLIDVYDKERTILIFLSHAGQAREKRAYNQVLPEEVRPLLLSPPEKPL